MLTLAKIILSKSSKIMMKKNQSCHQAAFLARIQFELCPVPSNTSNLMLVFYFAQHVTCPFEFLTHDPTDEFDD